MGLGLPTGGGGAIIPYVKLDGKLGRVVTRVVDAEGKFSDKKVKGTFQMVVDIARVQTGWFRFEDGAAPNIKLDAQLGKAGPQPSPAHKRGFRVLCFGKAIEGVRELQGTSAGLNAMINAIFDAWEAEGADEGKCPVIKIDEEWEEKQAAKGVVFAPRWSIEKWVARPNDLAEIEAPAPADDETPPPPKEAAGKKAPAKSEEPSADDTEF